MALLRAGFYIDGFNFYHAVRDLSTRTANLNHLKWLSYKTLAGHLVERNESVEFVKLFTAHAEHVKGAVARHSLFNRANESHGVEIIMGKFKRVERHCKSCRSRIRCAVCTNCGTCPSTDTYTAHEEKESDVNIALHLLADCFDQKLDVAYVVTCDTDISPAIRMCKRRCPKIEFVSVAPPGMIPIRQIGNVCRGQMTVSRRQVETSLLPATITDAKGTFLRPREYDPPC